MARVSPDPCSLSSPRPLMNTHQLISILVSQSFSPHLVSRCRYWTGPSKHTEALKAFEGSTERDYVGPLGTSGEYARYRLY